jgi:hypothetical protein
VAFSAAIVDVPLAVWLGWTAGMSAEPADYTLPIIALVLAMVSVVLSALAWARGTVPLIIIALASGVVAGAIGFVAKDAIDDETLDPVVDLDIGLALAGVGAASYDLYATLG